MKRIFCTVALLMSLGAAANDCKSAQDQYLKSAEHLKEVLTDDDRYSESDAFKADFDFHFRDVVLLKRVCPARPDVEEIENKCRSKYFSRKMRLYDKLEEIGDKNFRRGSEIVKEMKLSIKLKRVELDESLCNSKSYI